MVRAVSLLIFNLMWCSLVVSRYGALDKEHQQRNIDLIDYEIDLNWKVKLMEPLMAILLKPVKSDGRIKRSSQPYSPTNPLINPIWVPISPVDSYSTTVRPFSRPTNYLPTFKPVINKKILKSTAQKKHDKDVYDYYPHQHSISVFMGYHFSILGLIAILATGLLYLLFFVYIVTTTTTTTTASSGKRRRRLVETNDITSGLDYRDSSGN